MKILIVDDHKVVRDGVKYILKNHSNLETIIHEAEDGEEAIEMAGHFKYDVIIMDINMPYMSGLEATAKIMALEKNNKIIALSMYDDGAHISKMIDAGASGYILKNSGADELLKAIKLISRGEKYFSGEVQYNLSKLKNDQPRNSESLFSKREKEIIILIANSFSNREIGEQLSISTNTVNSHRNNILIKLQAKNTVGIIKYAIDNDWI